MTATITLLPTLIDRVLAESTPGIDTICIDPDPEMTALLAEPAPARTTRDIILDMIGEQNAEQLDRP